MPKRVIDFDAMWGSDKLAACAAWAQGEYAWLYGLADASGCFELTNLRVIWGRVAAIRGNFTIERLEQVFAEFQDKGLLFVWEHEGKRYAHWTGSDVPGRLPPPSWRMRLEKFAPPVPKQQLAEYMAKFARGRAALGGAGFRGEAQRESRGRREDLRSELSDLKDERGSSGRAPGLQMSEPRLLVTDRGEDRGYRSSNLKENAETGERFENSRLGERRATVADGARDGLPQESRDFRGSSGLKERLERAQGQDWDLNLDLNGNWDGNLEVGREARRIDAGEARVCLGEANREKELAGNDSYHSKSNSHLNINANSNKPLRSNARIASQLNSHSSSNSEAAPPADLHSHSRVPPCVELQSQSRLRPDASLRASASGGMSEGAGEWKDASRAEVRAGSEPVRSAAPYAWRQKDLAVARELRVGEGPVCGPAPVKPEVLERIRRREAARAGSRSP